ncbi:MFS transporter [Saccharothrix variisporea]|uniref:Putative MFS family arabinose efflux permease n=1 Tax=Saccharothrix variisporea TaxID=543527 RepID=A0A495X221_9PSEU|nr:MFS transporter [Saccharothrix variisporea]RKT68010.1 putative MFS family arabinose efflux permease [Saccharothrix variisporea]
MGVAVDEVPGDLAMARRLWPLMLASSVALLPYTIFGTFLVRIASDADTDAAVMGGLRGLGGLAALAAGAVLAPLLDRVARLRAAALGLVALAVAALVGALGHLVAMGVFCALVGAAMAVITPALTASAADRFGDGAAAGRAATLVTATSALTVMLAAPVVAVPALLWGWRGDLVMTAVVALGLAVVFYRRPGRVVPASTLGYWASYKALKSLRPLLAVALLRTAAFMGYLSYLAVIYDARFGLSPSAFALVWTLSGGSYFFGNLITGRVVGSGRVRAHHVMFWALVVSLGAIVAIYFTTTLVVAVVLTGVLGVCHSAVAACVITLMVRHSGDARGTALGVTGASVNLGTFAGALVGGVGLGFAGLPGAAAVFGGITVLSLVPAAVVWRSERSGGGTTSR